MTQDEAIKAIDANWPTENYTMLREALTMAKAALRSRPAPPDDLVAKLASIEWAGGSDGDGIASCPACQRRRFYHDDRRNHRADCWLAAALAAPAPVAAPAPAVGCLNCGEQRDGGYFTAEGNVGPFCEQCWHMLRDEFAAPAPETPGSEDDACPPDCPGCMNCDPIGSYRSAPETPAPDANPHHLHPRDWCDGSGIMCSGCPACAPPAPDAIPRAQCGGKGYRSQP